MTRTPLSYYGGKQTLAPHIVSLMPRHDAYLEPFAGGAAVFFAKPRADRETLNDIDGQIMAFWRALRDRPEELASAVSLTPYAREEWLAASEPADDDVEAARRLLVRIDHSFVREGRSWSPPSLMKDRKGRWQPRTWSDMPRRIRAAADRLAGVCLEHGDAAEMLSRWDFPGSLIYLDPPYLGPGRRAPGKGYDHDLTPDLWPRLVDALLAVKHAAVVLSGYPNDEVARLEWRSITLKAKRDVPQRGSQSEAPESVWLSPAVPEEATLFTPGLTAEDVISDIEGRAA